jgi:hypothetical protein
MTDNSIEKLKYQIFDETDGNKFSKLKDKLLKKYSAIERDKVIEILKDYTKNGKLLFWREFLLTDIIELVNENENVNYFEWTITEPQLTYWGIEGLIKTSGKNSYDKLIELILSDIGSVEIKAKAIKSIALKSKQPFDAGLPSDPGYWKQEDFRIEDIINWQKNGYKDGQGYSEPKTHSSLANPQTEFELVVSELNKKLEIQRTKNEDLSNPTNWLKIADETDILNIESRWTLPEIYLQFLKYYSPLQVTIYNKKYYQGLSLYGASNLIKSQQGYFLNPVTNEEFEEWPKNFVVIADAGADPFCINLNKIKDNDAPIYKSMHGNGEWKFKLYADSFLKFLKDITGK